MSRSFDFASYIELAQRTAANGRDLRGDIGATLATLEVLVSAGGLADLLKRQIFYRQPATREMFASKIEDIRTALDMLEESVEVSVNQEDALPFHPKILHGTIGTIGEEAEMLSAMLDAATAGTDVVNIIEEAGDALWYQAEKLVGVQQLTGSDALAIADANIAKLSKRYGDAFSEHDAVNRDLVAEREALEGRA